MQQENFDREKQQLREKIKSSESSIKQIRLEQETLISRCEDLNKVLLATEDRLIRSFSFSFYVKLFYSNLS